MTAPRRLWPLSSAAAVLLFVGYLVGVSPPAPASRTVAPVTVAAVQPGRAEDAARLRSDTSVVLPGEPRRGLAVYHAQGCASCHAIWGIGASVGPDLGRISMSMTSTGDLVAAFWNHGPRMWDRSRGERAETAMTIEETADLIAFLTFVKTLDPPGDPVRGRAVLAERRCLECHMDGKPSRLPQLVEWATSSNPIHWAHRMWAAAPRMQDEMRRRGIPWPVLEQNDLADIIAYVRTVGRPSEPEVFLRPGSARRGEASFFSEGCAKCHLIEGRGGGRIDLTNADLPRTLSGVAARLWNSYPRMSSAAGAASIPTLSPQKMADIAAFLFAVRYYSGTGDAARGGQVFKTRGCGRCHTVGADGGIPIRGGRRFSTIELARAIWNHGPRMAARTAAIGEEWPTLRGDEVNDLARYLDEAR